MSEICFNVKVTRLDEFGKETEGVIIEAFETSAEAETYIEEQSQAFADDPEIYAVYVEEAAREAVIVPSDGLCLYNLSETVLDFNAIENRRFMYHPSGLLLLGEEDTVNVKGLFKSHAEEHGDAEERFGIKLPPYDDFIKGWIGVGGKYKHGVVHFAPSIPSERIDLFEKAFSFVESVLENGFTGKTVLRGFGNVWEQTIGEMLGLDRSLDKQIRRAERQGSKQDVKSCEIKEREL